MFGPSLLRDDQIEPLAEGVYKALEGVGILCQNAELLAALEAFGAQVDVAAERVRFPRSLTAQFADSVRQANAGDSGWPAAVAAPGLASMSTHVAQFFLDDETGEKRSSNQADFITCAQFGSALHPGEAVYHALAMTDVPPNLEPLHAGLLLAEWAYDPGSPFAWNAAQVDYLVEMGEILGKPNWFSLGAMCFAHPLRLDRDVADRFVRQVRANGTAGITAMPVAGVTTPITPEGFVVVTAAEFLATWMAGRALNPNCPLGGSMWAGSVDMSTGTTSYSTFDSMFYAFASVEFMRRWCSAYIPVGAGEYCAAKVPGMYTALEKAYKAMVTSAFTGQPLSSGTGLVDEGKTLSLVQMLLDRDFATGAGFLAQVIDPSPGNLALAEILEVGLGFEHSHFDTEHTLSNFRRCAWLPQLIDRSGWNGFAAEEAILAKARQGVKDILAEYRKPEGREEQLAALRGVLERARRELG
jgi:trimethylamine:corrinoid methyltransferase-like protein